MSFFSLLTQEILSQSRGEEIALAPLWHSSVVVRRGERRFRYNRPESAAPSGDPHSPNPLSPGLPPALTGERGLQSPSLSGFLPLLPSGREGGWEKRVGVMRANGPRTPNLDKVELLRCKKRAGPS